MQQQHLDDTTCGTTMEGGTGPNATGCRAWQRETAVVRASLAMTVVGRCGGAPWVAKLTKNNSTSTTRMREMMMMMENNNKIMSIKKTTTNHKKEKRKKKEKKRRRGKGRANERREKERRGKELGGF